MVARLDFGVSATGMGDSTTKITWTISLLTLLRLVYIAYIPQILQSPNLDVQTSKQNAKQDLRTSLTKELDAMKIFGVAGSLFVCICALLKIVWLGMQRQHGDSRLVQWIRKHQIDVGPKISVLFLILLPTFAVRQIWTIRRMRRFQADIWKDTGNVDFHSQWMFG
ncbi:MAG: hypothetical protein LQ343_002277 [Gyalolechia ehrenbergii]|nr:MAG: hypothetical protein LQ343_002277 [Gyalolechia ehrenbergii]